MVLIFKGYSTYSNTGGVYRVWRLGEGITTPVEAEAGWILFDDGPEVEDDDRFHLRTPDGDVDSIVWLDHWQGAALFEGGQVPEWTPPLNLSSEYRAGVLAVLEEVEAGIDRIRQQFGFPEKYAKPQAAPKPNPENEPEPEPTPRHPLIARAIPAGPDGENVTRYTALEVTRDIPAAGLKAGALLLWFRWAPRRGEWDEVKLPVTPVARSLFNAIIAHEDALAVLEHTKRSNWDKGSPLDVVVKQMRRNANDPRAKTWKLETTRLWLLPSLDEPVSEPITASSDDAAIFELIASVGCRMPVTESYTR